MLDSVNSHSIQSLPETSDLTVQDFEITQCKTNELVSVQYFCNKAGEPIYFPDRTLATLFQVNLSTLRGRFNRLTKKYNGYRLLISEKSKARMTSLHFINWDNATAANAGQQQQQQNGGNAPIIVSESISSSSLGSSTGSTGSRSGVVTSHADDLNDLANNYSTSLHGLVALNHIVLVNHALSEWIAHNHERLGTSLREIESNLSRAQLSYTRQGDVIVLQQRKFQPGSNPSVVVGNGSSSAGSSVVHYSPKLSALSFLASSSSPASSSMAASSGYHSNNSSAPVTPRVSPNGTHPAGSMMGNPFFAPATQEATYSLASFINDLAVHHQQQQQQQQSLGKYQMVSPSSNSASSAMSPSLTSTFRTLSPPFPNSNSLMYDRHFYETVSPNNSPSFGPALSPSNHNGGGVSASPLHLNGGGNHLHHLGHLHHHSLLLNNNGNIHHHNENNSDSPSRIHPNISSLISSATAAAANMNNSIGKGPGSPNHNNNNNNNNNVNIINNNSKKRSSFDSTSSESGSDSEVSSPLMSLKRQRQDSSPSHNFSTPHNNTVIKCKLFDQESYKKVDISLFNGFSSLRETLSSMFAIGHSFVICYQDSENDIIEINDQEDDWFDFCNCVRKIVIKPSKSSAISSLLSLMNSGSNNNHHSIINNSNSNNNNNNNSNHINNNINGSNSPTRPCSSYITKIVTPSPSLSPNSVVSSSSSSLVTPPSMALKNILCE